MYRFNKASRDEDNNFTKYIDSNIFVFFVFQVITIEQILLFLFPYLFMLDCVFRVILFHEFWKSPLQLVNTTVFLESKQHLIKAVFSKMLIDRRKRLFVAKRTTSRSIFSFFQSKSILVSNDPSFQA